MVLKVDGFSYSVGSSGQGYPNQCGSGGWTDGRLDELVQFDNVKHTGDTATLELTTTLDEDANNESFGIRE